MYQVLQKSEKIYDLIEVFKDKDGEERRPSEDTHARSNARNHQQQQQKQKQKTNTMSSARQPRLHTDPTPREAEARHPKELKGKVQQGNKGHKNKGFRPIDSRNQPSILKYFSCVSNGNSKLVNRTS